LASSGPPLTLRKKEGRNDNAGAHPIGNSVGVVPNELLARLGVQQGDTLHMIDTLDGVRPSTADPEFEAEMEVARRLMKKWNPVLRELAK